MGRKTLLGISMLAFLLAASSLIAYFQGSAPETEIAWVCPKFEEERARELIKIGTNDIRTDRKSVV